MRIGSLCSGYGGLDLAIGGDVAWHVEYDPAPAKILAQRFPGVPNYGDLTAMDWHSYEVLFLYDSGEWEVWAGSRRSCDVAVSRIGWLPLPASTGEARNG